MNYEMTPENYFKKIIEMYHNARNPKLPMPNPNIHRGRSSSISSEVEDLTAYFIAYNAPNKKCDYFIDQPMKFAKGKTYYPDIAIQNDKGEIENLIDVKIDLGWNRSGIYSFCKEWESRIKAIKGKETSFKRGKDKTLIKGRFSKDIKYHVVVITGGNSGSNLQNDRLQVMKDMKHVCLYVLSDGVHPNDYKLSHDAIMKTINIDDGEFKRFLSNVI